MALRGKVQMVIEEGKRCGTKYEETYTFDEANNISETEFVENLLTIGVRRENIIGIEGAEDDICGGDEITVSSSNIYGKTYSRSELLNMQIEYTYCRIEKDD